MSFLRSHDEVERKNKEFESILIVWFVAFDGFSRKIVRKKVRGGKSKKKTIHLLFLTGLPIV